MSHGTVDCGWSIHLITVATTSILSSIICLFYAFNVKRLSFNFHVKSIQPDITIFQICCLSLTAASGLLLCFSAQSICHINQNNNITSTSTSSFSSSHSSSSLNVTTANNYGAAYYTIITFGYCTFFAVQYNKSRTILRILKAGLTRKSSKSLLFSMLIGTTVGLFPAIINIILYSVDVSISILFAVGAATIVILNLLGQRTRSQLLPLLMVHSLERLDESNDSFCSLVVFTSVYVVTLAWSTGAEANTAPDATALGYSIASSIASISICHLQYWPRLRTAMYPKETWHDVPSEAHVANSFSTNADTVTALQQAVQDLVLKLGGKKINLLIVQLTCTHDGKLVEKMLDQLLPGVPYVGSTSCRGVMSETGWKSNDDHTVSLGLLGIKDEAGSYAVANSSIDADQNAFDVAVQTTKLLLQRGNVARTSAAIQVAGDRQGVSLLKPSFIWCSVAPGYEEMVLEGIRSVVGLKCPIIGGSSADNEVKGEWYQLCSEDKRYTQLNGFSIGIAYSSMKTKQCFFSCYTPTAFRGIITKGNGRHIYEIDHEPAAEVYNRWTGGELKKELDLFHGDDTRHASNSDDLNVLGRTTLYPLGKKIGSISDESFFQIIHPSNVNKDGSFDTFANIKQGDEIYCMAGTKENLKHSISKCAQQLLHGSSVQLNEVIGALVVFCGGMVLAIEDSMDIPCKRLSAQLGGSPFLGMHTFGELGKFPDGSSMHGNLMVSVLLFTSRRRNRKIVNSRTGQVKILHVSQGESRTSKTEIFSIASSDIVR